MSLSVGASAAEQGDVKLLKLELMRYKHCNENKQDRQCTNNLTLWHVAIVAVEGNNVRFVLMN